MTAYILILTTCLSAPKSTLVEAPPSSKEVVEAEATARLQRTIKENEEQLEKLKVQKEDENSEYNKAQKAFNMFDAQREELTKQRDAIKGMNKPEELANLEKELAKVEEQWKAARERFTLALKERKALQEKMETLPQLIQKDKEALAKLLGEKKTEEKKTDTPTQTPTEKPTDQHTTPPTTPISLPTLPEKKTTQSPEVKKTEEKKDSPEIQKAKEQAKVKEEEANEAKEKAQTIEEQIEAIQKIIEADQQALETARQKSDLARKERDRLDKEGKHDPEKMAEVSNRIQQAVKEVRATTDHLNENQKRLTSLQQERIHVLQEAKKKTQQAEDAHKHLADLQNPYSLRNIVQWGLRTGPKLASVIIAMILLHCIVRWSSKRLIQFMARRGRKRGRWEKEDRAETLSGVFRNVGSLFIWGGGTLMSLDVLGVPIVPLMGGAAVLGLAVAFGAQNLVRDYFTGFMVLMEDQYAVNDCVRIGDQTGIVERISLRMTVIRDIEGVVHFIPHGTITTVSNYSHGWSRAVFNVGVSYRENVDEVMQILNQLSHEIRQDPIFGGMILEDAEMLGVDAFGDSSVVIKFFLKTRPLKQWKVKRELNRRIKHRFDELGIEIPFPHRTVYHRYEDMENEVERLVA